MGILDRFRRKKRKKVGEGVKYILKRKGEKGGFEKVFELPRMMTPEELYPSLAPGVYIVHKYEMGTSGFTESGPAFEVMGGEAPTPGAPARRASPLSGLREFAADMKTMKEDIAATFEVLGPMAGYQKVGEKGSKGLLAELKEAKEDLQLLHEIFPQSTTGTKEIPIAGSIPAWMVFAPQAIDSSLDGVEKRLLRWGLISQEQAAGVPQEDIIKLPEKPKALRKPPEIPAETPTEEVVEKTVEKEKPGAGVGIREVDVGKEEKKKEKGKGGKKTK